MSAQEWAVAALGLAALLYLVRRVVQRRRARTCCGARACPAARESLRRMGSGTVRPPR